MSYWNKIKAAFIACLIPSFICAQSHGRELLSKVEEIPDKVWDGMQGNSWHPQMGCPERNELVLLTVPFNSFKKTSEKGQLIVARKVSASVIRIFEEIYLSGQFQIERIELVDKFGGDDSQSMIANNTSAFNCRLVTGGKRLSNHASGTAIDINPVQNPWVNKGRFAPTSGAKFARPMARVGNIRGLIERDSVVTKAFAREAWFWGGRWNRIKDYQHFSNDGK